MRSLFTFVIFLSATFFNQNLEAGKKRNKCQANAKKSLMRSVVAESVVEADSKAEDGAVGDLSQKSLENPLSLSLPVELPNHCSAEEIFQFVLNRVPLDQAANIKFSFTCWYKMDGIRKPDPLVDGDFLLHFPETLDVNAADELWQAALFLVGQEVTKEYVTVVKKAALANNAQNLQKDKRKLYTHYTENAAECLLADNPPYTFEESIRSWCAQGKKKDCFKEEANKNAWDIDFWRPIFDAMCMYMIRGIDVLEPDFKSAVVKQLINNKALLQDCYHQGIEGYKQSFQMLWDARVDLPSDQKTDHLDQLLKAQSVLERINQNTNYYKVLQDYYVESVLPVFVHGYHIVTVDKLSHFVKKQGFDEVAFEPVSDLIAPRWVLHGRRSPLSERG